MKSAQSYISRSLLRFFLFLLVFSAFVSLTPAAYAGHIGMHIAVIEPTKYDPVKKTLTITVHNYDDNDVAENLEVYYYTIDGRGQKSKRFDVPMPVTDVPIGQKVTKTIPFTATSTMREIEVHAYISYAWGFWDEYHSSKTVKLALPDLVATDMGYENGKGAVLEITNDSTVTAQIPANTVSVKFNSYQTGQNTNTAGSYIGEPYVPATTLAPGGKVKVTLSGYSPVAQTAAIKGTIRPGSFAEVDKEWGNNVIIYSLFLPKLEIDQEVTKYDELAKKIIVGVKNAGGRDIYIPGNKDISIDLRYKHANRNIDDIISLNNKIPYQTLVAGQTTTVSFDYTPGPQITSVVASIFIDPKILMAGRDNRTKEIFFLLPDITIIDAKPNANGNLVATVTNVNPDTQAWVGGVKVNCYGLTSLGIRYYDLGVGYIDKLPLKYNEHGSATCSKKFEPHMAAAELIVNESGSLAESDAANPFNNFYKYNNTELADLAVKLEMINLNVTAPAIWIPRAVVTNEGKKPALVELSEGEFTFYNGTQPVGTSPIDMHGTLEPGASVKFDASAVADNVTDIKVEIDKNNTVIENGIRDPLNNKDEIKVPRKPDLNFTDLINNGNSVTLHIVNDSSIKFDGEISIVGTWDKGNDPITDNTGPVSIEPGSEFTHQVRIQPSHFTSRLRMDITTPVEEQWTYNNYNIVTIPGDEKLTDLLISDQEDISKLLAASISGNPDIDPEKVAGILPDSPFYFIDELGRDIQVTFTFDDEVKADLENKFANEQLLETSVMIDKNESSKKVTGAIEKTAHTQDKVDEAAEKLKKTRPDLAKDLFPKILGDKLKGVSVLDKLKGKIDLEDLEKANAAEDKILDSAGELSGQIEDPEKLKAAIEVAFGDKGSPYKPLKDLTAINKITTHVANGNARNILLGAKEKQQNLLKNNLQSMKPDQLNFLKEYVDKTTGDKVNTLKALDDAKVGIADKNVRAVISSAKQSTAAKLVKDLKTAKGKKLKAGDTILSDLEGGTITDLRVLSDLKSADKDIAADIAAAKNKSINNFAKNVSGLKPQEKQAFLSNITKNNVDLTQQAVINDVRRALPNNKIGNEMDAALKSEVKLKVAKAKTNKAEYDEFLSSVTGDTTDDKETINAFTAGFDANFFKDIMRQQLNYMKDFYAGADPETKKFFDEYYFNDPQIKAFYTDFDKEFEKLFSGFNTEEYNAETASFEEQEEETADSSEWDTNTTSGCAMIDEPVCGKDGLNYANECEAKDNDTEVDYKGECREENYEPVVEQQSEEQPVEQETQPEEASGSDEVLGVSTIRKIQFPWSPLFWLFHK